MRDNGVGIAAEQLTGIFEMFVQVDASLERSAGGLGIGLTLVKNLGGAARRNGGGAKRRCRSGESVRGAPADLERNAKTAAARITLRPAGDRHGPPRPRRR